MGQYVQSYKTTVEDETNSPTAPILRYAAAMWDNHRIAELGQLFSHMDMEQVYSVMHCCEAMVALSEREIKKGGRRRR